MSQSWKELLKESTLVQAFVTALYTCVVLYLVATGQPVVDRVWYVYTALLGFWFGSKLAYSRKVNNEQ